MFLRQGIFMDKNQIDQNMKLEIYNYAKNNQLLRNHNNIMNQDFFIEASDLIENDWIYSKGLKYIEDDSESFYKLDYENVDELVDEYIENDLKFFSVDQIEFENKSYSLISLNKKHNEKFENEFVELFVDEEEAGLYLEQYPKKSDIRDMIEFDLQDEDFMDIYAEECGAHHGDFYHYDCLCYDFVDQYKFRYKQGENLDELVNEYIENYSSTLNIDKVEYKGHKLFIAHQQYYMEGMGGGWEYFEIAKASSYHELISLIDMSDSNGPNLEELFTLE